MLKCNYVRCKNTIPEENKDFYQCDRCGGYFCNEHLNANLWLCADCEKESKLRAFEYVKHKDGRYTIKKLRDRSESILDIPSFVRLIEDGAFEGSNVADVEICEGVEKIGARVCEVYLPEGNPFPKHSAIDRQGSFFGLPRTLRQAARGGYNRNQRVFGNQKRYGCI